MLQAKVKSPPKLDMMFSDFVNQVVQATSTLFDNNQAPPIKSPAGRPPLAKNRTRTFSIDPELSIHENQEEYKYEDMLKEHGIYLNEDEDVEEAQRMMEQRFRSLSTSRRRSDSSFSAVSSMNGGNVSRWSKDSRCKVMR
jgi:hypothetical protein